MTIIKKAVVSLVITLVLFTVFTIISYSTLFHYIESKFYNKRIITEVETRIDDIKTAIEEYENIRLEILTAVSNESAIRNSFLINQSREDIFRRENIINSLVERNIDFYFVRVIDGDGKIHYSNNPADIQSSDPTRISYKTTNTHDIEKHKDFANSIENTPSIIFDAQEDCNLFVAPIFSNTGVKRGSIFVYLTINDLRNFLVQKNIIERNIAIKNLDQNNIVFNIFDNASSVLDELRTYWTTRQIKNPYNLYSDFEENSYSVITKKWKDGFIGYLIPDFLIKINTIYKYILLLSAFSLTYIFSFLLMNLRQDQVIVIAERVKRFQINFLIEYLENKSEVEWKVWKKELQNRKEEVRKEFKKGIRGLKGDKDVIVNDLVDKSWDEIISLLAGHLDKKSDTKNLVTNLQVSNIEEIIRKIITSEDILRSKGIGAISKPQDASVTAIPVSAKAEPVDVEDVEEVEEFIEEELEEVEEVAEAEEAEEIEELDEVEALEEESGEEELEEAEALDEAEEVLEEAEALDEAEEVLEEAEALDEAEEVLEEAEALDEAEEVLEEAEEVAKVEELEDLEEAEVTSAEESEELEEIEELDEVEAPAEAAPEELEETVEELTETRKPETVSAVSTTSIDENKKFEELISAYRDYGEDIVNAKEIQITINEIEDSIVPINDGEDEADLEKITSFKEELKSGIHVEESEADIPELTEEVEEQADDEAMDLEDVDAIDVVEEDVAVADIKEAHIYEEKSKRYFPDSKEIETLEVVKDFIPLDIDEEYEELELLENVQIDDDDEAKIVEYIKNDIVGVYRPNYVSDSYYAVAKKGINLVEEGLPEELAAANLENIEVSSFSENVEALKQEGILEIWTIQDLLGILKKEEREDSAIIEKNGVFKINENLYTADDDIQEAEESEAAISDLLFDNVIDLPVFSEPMDTGDDSFVDEKNITIKINEEYGFYSDISYDTNDSSPLAIIKLLFKITRKIESTFAVIMVQDEKEYYPEVSVGLFNKDYPKLLRIKKDSSLAKELLNERKIFFLKSSIDKVEELKDKFSSNDSKKIRHFLLAPIRYKGKKAYFVAAPESPDFSINSLVLEFINAQG